MRTPANRIREKNRHIKTQRTGETRGHDFWSGIWYRLKGPPDAEARRNVAFLLPTFAPTLPRALSPRQCSMSAAPRLQRNERNAQHKEGATFGHLFKLLVCGHAGRASNRGPAVAKRRAGTVARSFLAEFFERKEQDQSKSPFRADILAERRTRDRSFRTLEWE